MLEIIIYIILAIVIIALLIRYEFKKLERDVFQSIKRLGIKALSIFAVFNIFNSSNNELPKSEQDNKESD
jgi:L-lactate permease